MKKEDWPGTCEGGRVSSKQGRGTNVKKYGTKGWGTAETRLEKVGGPSMPPMKKVIPKEGKRAGGYPQFHCDIQNLRSQSNASSPRGKKKQKRRK